MCSECLSSHEQPSGDGLTGLVSCVVHVGPRDRAASRNRLHSTLRAEGGILLLPLSAAEGPGIFLTTPSAAHSLWGPRPDPMVTRFPWESQTRSPGTQGAGRGLFSLGSFRFSSRLRQEGSWGDTKGERKLMET